MVITGYYAQLKKYQEKGLELINIARYKPQWLTIDIKSYSDLFPTDKMLSDYKETNNVDLYIYNYMSEILNKLDPAKVYKDLDNKIILCYEKPTDFCHRHLVSIWLNNNGYIAREFNVSNLQHQPTWGYSWSNE